MENQCQEIRSHLQRTVITDRTADGLLFPVGRLVSADYTSSIAFLCAFSPYIKTKNRRISDACHLRQKAKYGILCIDIVGGDSLPEA